jgi:predicted RND superfamily exporter protein
VKTIIRLFANAVTQRPWIVIATTLVASLVFGGLAATVENSDGQEGFSPDNEVILASERVNELFGDAATQSVMQVIVRSETGDLISADGLAAANAVTQALLSSDEAEYISGQSPQQPGVVTWMAPVQQALAEQGTDPAQIPADQIPGIYAQALEQGGEQLGFVSQLVTEDQSTGLVLVFIDTTDDQSTQIDREVAIADTIKAVDVPSGIELRPFSFGLLFSDSGDVQSEIGRLFGFAFLIIIGILLFVYWLKPRGQHANLLRSTRRTAADMGLTMLTIVLAIAWMNGIGALLQRIDLLGPLTEIAQIVPILLIGLGVDYGIHLTSRYREEVGEGDTVAGGIRRAIGTVGVALALATVTTAIGFLTNVVNPIPALKDFGILASIGIVVSFVLMLTFVPAMRHLLDRRAENNDELPREAMGATGDRFLPQIMEKTAVFAERAPIPTLVVMLGLGVLGYIGLANISTEFSFTDFLPDDSEYVQTFDTLAEAFGGGFGETTQVLIEGDTATPEAYNAMAVAAQNMADTPDVLTFQTPFGEQAAVTSPVSVVQQLLIPGPDGQPAFPQFAQAAVANGLDPQTGAAGPDADVAGIYAAAAEVAPVEMGAVYTAEGTLIEVSTQAGEDRAGELNEALKADIEPVTDAGFEAIPTSQNIIGDEIVSSLSASQVQSLVITLIAATIVLAINFWFENRRPFLGVLTMIPVALVVLWTFGAMYLSGIPFGPVTATLTGLAVGIGVPYTIHMARRFEEDRSRFADIDDAIRSTTRHTGGALAGSAFTTAAGFGILVTSSLTPFRQMGQVTAYAIVLSLFGAVMVLPSLLVLWEGWHRRRGDAAVERETVSVA